MLRRVIDRVLQQVVHERYAAFRKDCPRRGYGIGVRDHDRAVFFQLSIRQGGIDVSRSFCRHAGVDRHVEATRHEGAEEGGEHIDALLHEDDDGLRRGRVNGARSANLRVAGGVRSRICSKKALGDGSAALEQLGIGAGAKLVDHCGLAREQPGRSLKIFDRCMRRRVHCFLQLVGSMGSSMGREALAHLNAC